MEKIETVRDMVGSKMWGQLLRNMDLLPEGHYLDPDGLHVIKSRKNEC